MIYSNDDILRFIGSIELPRSRKGVEFKKFICDELDNFMKEVFERSESKNRALSDEFYYRLVELKPLIQSVVDSVKNSLSAYDRADYLEANRHVYEILDEINHRIQFIDLRTDSTYYRIRGVQDKDNLIDRKGIFHVPFKLRKHINTSRYSLHGMPSLYLGTQAALCWYESGMPKRYYASKFELCENKKLRLLDFSTFPFELASGIDFSIRNKKNNLMGVHEAKLIEFIVMYPLRLTSSISVDEKGNSFVHEYVFPQMILSWVKNRSDFDGIRYQSVSSYREAHEWNAYNVVLPVKNINEDGICKKLVKIFKISEPKYFSIKEFFESGDKYNKLKKMYEFVQSQIKFEKQFYLLNIEKILFSFISVVEDVLSEKFQNIDTLIRVLDGLYLGLDNIIGNKESFSLYMNKKLHIDEEFDENKLEEYYKLFEEFRRDVLIHFYRVGFLRMYNFNGFEMIL